MTKPDDRHEQGVRLWHEVTGLDMPPPSATPYDEATVDFVFGEVWSRPGLTRKERRWITLSCVAANGGLIPLRAHLAGALRSGDITIDELREFVLHFTTYEGWPKGAVLRVTLEEVWSEIQAG